jgi:PLP dependent protein
MAMHETSAVERLAGVRATIERAATDAGRAGAVTLVAVSKTIPAEGLLPVIAAGQRVFGENRVQEAKAKWPALRQRRADLALHLIGPLQTNKVRDALSLFDVIETLDRPSLAVALAKEWPKIEKPPRLLVQVNTGEEAQKAGVWPGDADAFIGQCRELALPIDGLMCIPPADEPPSPHFALLAKIAARNGLLILSMGMSADFEAAIQLGATHVRVGSAIFDARS